MNKKSFILIGLMVLCLVSVLASASLATVIDVYPTGDVTLDAANIQAKLDSASSGDTIILHAQRQSDGQYVAYNFGSSTEAKQVYVTKDVEIKGERLPAGTTITLPWTSFSRTSNADRTVILGGGVTQEININGVINCKDTNVSNLSVNGIWFHQSQVMSIAVFNTKDSSSKVKIEDNVATDIVKGNVDSSQNFVNFRSGIFEAAANVRGFPRTYVRGIIEVKNNRIELAVTGAFIAAAISIHDVPELENAIVSGNTLEVVDSVPSFTGAPGVLFFAPSVPSFEASNNTGIGQMYAGIYTYNHFGFAEPKRILMKNNTINDARFVGLFVQHASGSINITGNTINGTLRNGIFIGAVSARIPVNIENNVVSANRNTGDPTIAHAPIFINNSTLDAVVKNNTLNYSGEFGMFVDNFSGSLTIEGNTIEAKGAILNSTFTTAVRAGIFIQSRPTSPFTSIEAVSIKSNTIKVNTISNECAGIYFRNRIPPYPAFSFIADNNTIQMGNSKLSAMILSGVSTVNNISGASLSNITVEGTANYGISLESFVIGSTFNNINFKGLTAAQNYISCLAGANNNTGTNICVPAGTTCSKFLLNAGTNNVFNKPALNTVSAPMACVEKPYSLQLSTVAPDTCPNFTYSASGLPTGLTINSSTGLISGTPTAGGSNTVTATATDIICGQTDSKTFSLYVNTAPTISVPNQLATLETAYTLDLSNYANDADNDPLTYSAEGLPAWASLNSGVITGTPTAAGTSTVTVTVSDGKCGSASASFTIKVKSPEELLQDLISKVKSYNLQQGISNSLDTKLTNAYGSLTAANADVRSDSINKLQAFINECNAQSGNKLTTVQAADLIKDANFIIMLLGLNY